MRIVLLAAALVVSLWPVAAIAYAVDRVLGGDGDDTPPVAAVTSTTPAPPVSPAVPAAASAAPPAPAAAPVTGSLEELNRLRGETADLVAALAESRVAAGEPDPALSTQALDVEAQLIDWQEASAGGNADALHFAELFAAIASAAADYAIAADAASRQRLQDAVARHRDETLQLEGG